MRVSLWGFTVGYVNFLTRPSGIYKASEDG